MSAGIARRVLLASVLLSALVGGGRGERIHRGVAAPDVRRLLRPPRRGAGRRLWLQSLAVGVAAIRPAAPQSEDSWTKFKQVDTNQDGRVDAAEFERAVRDTMAKFGRRRAEAEGRVFSFFEELFDYADIDGDKLLNAREMEFADFLQVTAGERRAEARRAAIKDKKTSGTPSADEEPLDLFGKDLARKLIDDHDADGDRKLSEQEFAEGMRKAARYWHLGDYSLDPEVAAWFQRLFLQADIDADGSLDEKETQYAAYVSEATFAANPFPDRKLASGFLRELDENGDGQIDMHEVARGVAMVIREGGSEQGQSIMHRLRDLFTDFDADGDGILDRQELARLSRQILQEL